MTSRHPLFFSFYRQKNLFNPRVRVKYLLTPKSCIVRLFQLCRMGIHTSFQTDGAPVESPNLGYPLSINLNLKKEGKCQIGFHWM